MDDRQYVHLHVHTDLSMLDGAARIGPLIAEAARLGQPAIAMTDHGNMFGAYDFHAAAVKAGIKPVLGIEAYVAPASRYDKKAIYWGPEGRKNEGDVSGGGAYTHMTLLAASADGLRNLFRLQSRGWTEGYTNKWPRVDDELLAQYAGGVIATTGCMGGAVPKRLRLGQYDEALKTAGQYQDIFGKENYFLELMDHGITAERELRSDLLALGRHLGLPPLVTNDTHYVTQDQAPAQDALLCIATGKRLTDADRFRFDGTGYHIKPASQMRAYWDELVPGGCDNTLLVAGRVTSYDEVFEHRSLMPAFPVPEGQSETALLRTMTMDGARRQYGNEVPAGRIEYELGVIDRMGFSGYFLVVADICRHARDNGIAVGPGRGSAAGSVVAYAMGITELDPIRFGLLFERFLNPERVSMPDIDLDFEDRRRGEVVAYITRTYGADRVCQIMNLGTLKAKAAVKDSTRILDLPYSLGEKIGKAFPPPIGGAEIGLDAIFQESHPRYREAAALRALYQDNPDARTVIDTARGIEGLVRQPGVHAAGVIISGKPLIDIIPVFRPKGEGSLVAGFTMGPVDNMGLLKMDCLGLRNLTVIADAVRHIKTVWGVSIDIAGLPLDDPAVYAMLACGETCGTFQSESAGMTELIVAIQPDLFEHVSAAQALYRPGPMDAGAHTSYARRKAGQEPVTPVHPELGEALEPVLSDTYGLVVYQEQVMTIAQVLAGYTLAQADLLRRAMGKKKKEILDREYVPFRDGMLERGYSEGAVRTIWDILIPFSGYAFCRSHAAAYALIAYRTAWLKCHYPAEYMAALLTSVSDDKDKTRLYLAECRRLGIKVLPPDVSTSGAGFTPVPGEGVRFGLAAISNIGDGAVNAIIATRQEDGPFASFPDFLCRVPGSACGKRGVESLIKAGAFDSSGEPRKGLTAICEQAMNDAAETRRDKASGQGSLFDGEENPFAIPVPPGEWGRSALLASEREMLGLYVSGHPLDGLEDVLSAVRDMTISELLASGRADGTVRLAGMITGVECRTTKTGSAWAVITLEDLDAATEICFFSDAWLLYSPSLTADRVISVTGRLSDRGKLTIGADSMQILDTSGGTKPVIIALGCAQAQEETVASLKRILLAHPGPVPVHLRIIPASGSRATLMRCDKFPVAPTPAFWGDVKGLLGAGSSS
jgi:DNA polymerase-3 subunit alpha